MTPGARVSAAIEVLDQIQDGAAAEQALTSWARGSRFAGSKDRAAVRDHVYGVLRRKASLGTMAQGTTGRDLMRAFVIQDALDVDALFSGEGHAPAALAESEMGPLSQVSDAWDQCDVPAWLWPMWNGSLGDNALPAGHAQQARAALYLRVNPRKSTQEQAIASLATEGIATVPHPSVDGCIVVETNERRVKLSEAYTKGMIEVQDAASQAAINRLNIADDATVLDYCAGGGGKALAIAARSNCTVTAHDISIARMVDIPVRAARAGVEIATIATDDLGKQEQFDVVICDAPCSGSGTWRRTPDAKWRLTQDKLNDYNRLQREVLASSIGLAKAGGTVVYMTCSVLDCENSAIVSDALKAHPDLSKTDELSLIPTRDWDGFYLCVLQST